MKKSIYFLAVGCVLALSACTNEDVVQESARQTNAIGFQQAVGKETRAIDQSTFSNFFVYGYYTKAGEVGGTTSVVSVFNDVLVNRKKEGETWSSWGYSNTRYWIPGAKYYFYAYSCDDSSVPTGVASFDITGADQKSRVLTLENYICDNSHMHDLVYAYSEGSTTNKVGEGPGIEGKEDNNPKVSFNFKHILSRVKVTFKSGFVSGYKIKVSDVQIQNIRNKGNYSPVEKTNTSAWTGSDQGKPSRSVEEPYIALEISGNNIATAATPAVGTEGQAGYVAAVAAVNPSTSAGYVIPCEYGEANVELVFKVEVQDKNGNAVYAQQITGTWKPNWEIGKSYNYNITINGTEAGLKKIEFDAQVINSWPSSDTTVSPEENDGTDIDINMTFESQAVVNNN